LAIIAGEAIAVRRSLHRMLLGLIDLVESGVIVLEAQTRSAPFDHCHVEVSAVGSSALASEGMLSTVISRLHLAKQTGSGNHAGQHGPGASGDCPITGARIDFETSPIAGVLFRARWRLPAERPVNGTVSDASGASRRPLVLVVDDHEVNRIVAAELVRTLGFDAVTACDGVEALAQCQRLHPAVVLMDLDMPGMDGLTATRRLRELERAGELAPCSIVAATANTTDEAREACAAAGMDGYLTKPLTAPTLGAELHRLCAGGVS
ncbi:MAG TPA: response regulator, partial [Burkholderiaceae bacterium]|nr:response regulator [Burkholderiaceae bacterium]